MPCMLFNSLARGKVALEYGLEMFDSTTATAVILTTWY